MGRTSAARCLHPQDAADALTTVDRPLRASQNLQPTHIINPARTKEIPQLGRGITQPHAVNHHLGIGTRRATDKQRRHRPGLPAGGGGYHAGSFIQCLAELQQPAGFQRLRIQHRHAGSDAGGGLRIAQRRNHQRLQFIFHFGARDKWRQKGGKCQGTTIFASVRQLGVIHLLAFNGL